MTQTFQALRFAPPEKSLFFPTLRKRVDAYFSENNISKNANGEMVVKAIVLFSGYLLPLLYMILARPESAWSLLLWVFMGVAVAGIGMSVMHDANHGAFSKSQRTNDWVGYSLNLLGGAVFNWKLQHNILHHTYTNIPTLDEDIKNRGVLSFHPYSRIKKMQRFQHIYAIFFYGLITLYWVIGKDWVQLAQFTRSGVNKNTPAENWNIGIRIALIKIFYFLVLLGLPLAAGMPAGLVIGGFLLMHFVAGVILTIIFQMAHTVEGTSHPMPNEQGVIENDWAIHQMETTVNFSRKNRLLSWYVGGLNYQVEHHLFPRICHVHYPKLAPIVEATAREFGVPYLENKTFGDALASHFRLMKTVGTLPSWNEAIG
jgi:linoleoyl-CoA desaturase